MTDQHSQLQLYRAGPRGKFVTPIRVTEREDVTVPETDLDSLAYLGSSPLGDLLNAEFETTEASLAVAGRPSVRIELDHVDEYGFGELLYAVEAVYVLYGRLASVNMFIQPTIEWGERATHSPLDDDDFEGADAAEEKSRLAVE